MKRVNTMNRALAALLLGAALTIAACASTPAAPAETVPEANGFNAVVNTEWLLAEVRVADGVTAIGRSDATGDTFTLRFDKERASGIGAPNRYTTPYTAGDGNKLTIGAVAGTMMAPLFEQPGLKEADFFAYLAKVNAWELRGGALELVSAAGDGTAVVLVFRPR